LYTVLLCDTEPIAMEGMRHLLESAGGLRVDAAETSLVDGKDAASEFSPSLIVMDKALGTQAIIDWIRELRRSPSPPDVIVWGTSISDSEGLRFLHAGASGVIRKTAKLDIILHCVRAVSSGGKWVEDDMLPRTAYQQRARSELTARELEVAELVKQGLKNREIALALGIQVGTVKIHLKHIFEKTGVHGRYNLAVSSLKDERTPVPLVV
jgi:DNA-binding NarL/FixJ family response regulator